MKIPAAAAALLIVFSLSAREATTAFLEATDEAVPSIPPRLRTALLKPGSRMTDVFGYDVATLSVEPQMMSLRLASNTVLTVATVPDGRDTLDVFIESVDLPQIDSRVAVYRADGTRLSGVKTPAMSDFVVPGREKEVKGRLDLPAVFSVACTYDPATGVFTFTNTSFTDVTRRTDADVAELFLSERRYTLHKGRLIPVKD